MFVCLSPFLFLNKRSKKEVILLGNKAYKLSIMSSFGQEDECGKKVWLLIDQSMVEVGAFN